MDTRKTVRLGLVAMSTVAMALATTVMPAAAQDETGAGKTIAIITPDYASQPASKEAIDLFITEMEGRGYDTKLTDTNSDNAAISGEITTAIAQQVDAIVTAFGTPQEFGEGLANADEAGMPVFGLDTGGVVAPTLVNVTSDAGFLGEASAQAIIDAIGGPGKVAIIHFDPFEPVRLRAVAARALFEANDFEIIEDTLGDPADSTGFARATVLDWLVKYPEGELDAVWAGWDATALGAFQATQETGRSDVLVTGVDGVDAARTEVAKDLNFIATVRQDWNGISTTLADAIDAHFAGTDPAESTVFVPGIVITAENAE